MRTSIAPAVAACVAAAVSLPSRLSVAQPTDDDDDDLGFEVGIYGLIVPAVEFSRVQGADRTEVPPSEGPSSIRQGVFAGEFTNNPAERPGNLRTISAPSHIGVFGSSRLPKDHYARFQWEFSSLVFGGTTVESSYSPGTKIISYDTGLVVGGFWGELGYGLWTTPLSRVGEYSDAYGALNNASMTMLASLIGGLPFANGAVEGQVNDALCRPEIFLGFVGPKGEDRTQCINHAMNFQRRQPNSLVYRSPQIAGFALRLQHEVNSRTTATNANVDLSPSLWSGSLSFGRGGIRLAVGLERSIDYIADAALKAEGLALGGVGSSQAQWSSGSAGIQASTGQGARLVLSYKFPFGLTLAALGEQLDYYALYDSAQPGDIEHLRKRAGRVEAVVERGQQTIGGAYHRALPIEGRLAGGNTFNGEGSAASAVTVGYAYKVSNQLHAQAFFSAIFNEPNSRYRMPYDDRLAPAGADLQSFGIGLRYNFSKTGQF